MKYFLDTEFIEGFRKRPFFRRHKQADHFIDLISIGIVCEDGRKLYHVCSEYDYNDASDWVKENVISPMYIQMVHGDQRNRLSVENFHKEKGLSRLAILGVLLEFFHCWRDQHFWRVNDSAIPEIYGYYADYDWVVFCSLFGKMIDLPKGFPMYCRDLKQMLDESYGYQENKHEGQTRLQSWLNFIKNHPDYPKQVNEHNALADAKWNYELYKFIAEKRFLKGSGESGAKTSLNQ